LLQSSFSSSFATLFEAFNETIPPFVTFMRPVSHIEFVTSLIQAQLLHLFLPLRSGARSVHLP
jgi:hypothetical protein